MIIAKPIPTDNPRGTIIGYENLLISASGVTPPKAIIPNTYERWVDAAGTMTGQFQTGTLVTIDFVAVGAHNLFTAGVSSVLISVTPTPGSGFIDVGSVSITNNSPFMLTFDTPLDDVAEVKIFMDDGTDREIGVVYAGIALQMERNIYGGHSPLALSQKTTRRSVETETGNFLSNNIIRKGLAGSFAWQFLDPDWYRENFQPFVESARTKPFFIKWRPDLYGDEVAYAHTTDDITPVNMGGGHKLMSVSINVKGHADV